MKKVLKITGLVVVCMVAWGLIAYGGLYAFGTFIYKQRTCAWANIDNIELHARVDIPQVLSCNCAYDAASNSKQAHFTIDRQKVDLDQYIQANGLKKLDAAGRNLLSNISQDEAALVAATGVSEAIYYTSGTQGAKSWQTMLDKSSGSLWVLIHYAD